MFEACAINGECEGICSRKYKDGCPAYYVLDSKPESKKRKKRISKFTQSDRENGDDNEEYYE